MFVTVQWINNEQWPVADAPFSLRGEVLLVIADAAFCLDSIYELERPNSFCVAVPSKNYMNVL